MPNLRNAKKALRQTEKRAKQNLIVKKAYKGAVKQMTKAIDAGEKDLQKTLQFVQKQLGKAAKKGVLKKNTAARKLSRLAARVNKVAKK